MSLQSLRFIDYFVICGLNTEIGLESDQLLGDTASSPPLDRSYKSRILAHYPEKIADLAFDGDAISTLCFPKGLKFTTQKDINGPYIHSFVITRDDGFRTYGVALTYYEDVGNRTVSQAMETLQKMYLAEFSGQQSPARQAEALRDRSRLHSRNLMSRLYNMNKDRLFVTKCIAVTSRLPFVSAFERSLRSIYVMIHSSKSPELPIESYIYNLIHEIPLPSPGQSMKLFTSSESVVCQRPGSLELPLFDYPLRDLFSLLTVDGILDLFTSVLLELQILLYSKDYQHLMLVAESVSTLIFPFQWQHVYVPILPASLIHFLDAPVPFIMGLHHTTDIRQLLDLCSSANMCVVDIDAGTVDVPDDLPVFPYRSILREELIATRTMQMKEEEGRKASHRDSGYRDSLISADDAIVSNVDDSNAGSMWSLPNKMDILQQSEAFSRVTALAKKTGIISSFEDISESLNESLNNEKSLLKTAKATLDDYARELLTNSTLRSVFVCFFCKIFNCFESFVIQPGQDMDSWLTNRESMQTFDKAAFLSDQPEGHLSFLSAFIETQMFTTFIDNKIISNWEDIDPSIQVFESLLATYREEINDQTNVKFRESALVRYAGTAIEKRALYADIVAVKPHLLEGCSQRDHKMGRLPLPDSEILNREPTVKPDYRIHHRQDRLHQQAKHLHLSSEQKERKRGGRMSWPCTPHSDPAKAANVVKYMQEARSKVLHQPSLSGVNATSLMETNFKFVQTLLKECKNKTKRIVVEKMGVDGVDLGHVESSRTGVEENTLIASLCDLLERIWSHGLQQKQGKSALWFHLVKYLEYQEGKSIPATPVNESNVPDENVPNSELSIYGGEGDTCPSGTQTWPLRRHRRKSNRGNELPTLSPMPTLLTYDIRNVQQMHDIKTDVGYARAWVRLSLERKLLSDHMKELLANSAILESLYKKYAFLMCDDEREQFLYHLLALNAVDFQCFTNAFINTTISYRVLIFPRIKMSGGTTTANCWFLLSGHLGETKPVSIPKNTLEICLDHKNLGVLTTMRIGHDNAGLSPKWMVEHVLVRNEISGHTYRFPCGQWLGRGVDDGSIERLLVAETVSLSTDHAELMERCRTPPRCRSPSIPRRSADYKYQLPEIQAMLGDAVNCLVKHFHKPEKERGTLTGLLCGENGLVYCLRQVFQFGFRSSRLFRNKFFVWDFIEKTMVSFDNVLHDWEHYRIEEALRRVMTSFCFVVTKINSSSEALGKDGKFQLFVCIGVRDQWLQSWIRAMAHTQAATAMYEEKSFIRDPALLQYLIHILDALLEFDITVEASLIKGVELYGRD